MKPRFEDLKSQWRHPDRSRSSGGGKDLARTTTGPNCPPPALPIDLPRRTHYHSRLERTRIMSLKIETREVAHVTILDIHGRIVLGDEIGDLRDAVHNLVAEGKKKIILNL